MSYPNQVRVTLLEIAGNSCGQEDAVSELSGTSGTSYAKIFGQLTLADVFQHVLPGGSITWRAKVRTNTVGSCRGIHRFERITAADDPTGDYGLLVGSTPDETAGKLVVVGL